MKATPWETGSSGNTAVRRAARASPALVSAPNESASNSAAQSLEDIANSLGLGEAERGGRRERARPVGRAEVVEIGRDGAGGALGDHHRTEVRIDVDPERAARIGGGGDRRAERIERRDAVRTGDVELRGGLRHGAAAVRRAVRERDRRRGERYRAERRALLREEREARRRGRGPDGDAVQRPARRRGDERDAVRVG